MTNPQNNPDAEFTEEQLRAMTSMGFLSAHAVDYYRAVRQLFVAKSSCPHSPACIAVGIDEAIKIIDDAGVEWGDRARKQKSKTYSAYAIAALDLRGRMKEARDKHLQGEPETGDPVAGK